MHRAVSKNAVKLALKADKAISAARELYLAHFGSSSEVFGSRMALSLASALEPPAPPCVLLNRFAAASARHEYILESNLMARVPGLLPQLFAWTREPGSSLRFEPFPRVRCDLSSGLLVAYHIDAASLLAVCALDPVKNARVLDMCAAPGGKSLAISQLLVGGGSLTANDVSPSRRKRLREVLSLYLPKRESTPSDVYIEDEASLPPLVSLTGVDATLPGAFGVGAFDHVLLDAPCSNDRHVFRDASELVSWGRGRMKVNAARQAALLSAALVAVRPGGTVVYSTCALSRTENDDVVERVLARTPGTAALVPLCFAFGEPTPLGAWHVLPDIAGVGAGFGPLYIAKLVRHV